MKSLLLIVSLTFSIHAQGFICAVGGESEEEGGWSDKSYRWIVEKSDSGKIVIISYDDNSVWLPNYFKSLGSSESFIININSRSDSELQSNYETIRSAAGIFIKGGDQEKYYDMINGSLAEQAIREVYENGGVIGGTSAGAMVLSEFSSLDVVYPDEALKNPLTGYIDIRDDFINAMPNVIFDTHFIQRGRWGRMIGFLYNVYHNWGREIVGIGIDDKTAICIDDNNIGTVYGSGAVSIFQFDDQTRIVDQGRDYTIEKLKCDQLTENWVFDFNTKSVSSIPPSARAFSLPIPFNYATNDAYIYGGDSFSSLINEDGMNEYLLKFLRDFSSVKFGLVYNTGYKVYADIIADSISLRDFKYTRVEISNDKIENEELADSIESCGAFIIVNNDLEEMVLAGNRGTTVGNAIYQKMLNNCAFFFPGSSVKLNGDILVDGADGSPNAAYYGRMDILGGWNNTPDVVYQHEIFDNDNYYENRSAAVLLGMMRKQKRFGVYLGSNDYMVVNSAVNNIELLNDEMPLMMIDSYETTHVDSSAYKMSSSANTRQVVAMNNLWYSISTIEKSFNLVDGSLSPITSVKNNYGEPMQSNFVLLGNYPNPFNPTTIIKYVVETQQAVSLQVYDVLGREVATLVEEVKAAGTHEVQFDAAMFAGGVYFYQLSIGGISETKKMLLLK